MLAKIFLSRAMLSNVKDLLFHLVSRKILIKKGQRISCFEICFQIMKPSRTLSLGNVFNNLVKSMIRKIIYFY